MPRRNRPPPPVVEPRQPPPRPPNVVGPELQEFLFNAFKFNIVFTLVVLFAPVFYGNSLFGTSLIALICTFVDSKIFQWLSRFDHDHPSAPRRIDLYNSTIVFSTITRYVFLSTAAFFSFDPEADDRESHLWMSVMASCAYCVLLIMIFVWSRLRAGSDWMWGPVEKSAVRWIVGIVIGVQFAGVVVLLVFVDWGYDFEFE